MTDLSANTHRSVVVIGASAGGLEALTLIVEALPRDLPAAVFVVIHQSPEHRSRLAEILSRVGPLPAELAVHGHPIRPGRIVVAPPDNHLMLTRGFITVVRGPKENGHRPAVDPLFRSAAAVYGRGVIAVLLSGALDCGTAGLLQVRARGGVTVVQDPKDAVVPSMPLNAIRQLTPDHVAPATELGAIIARLVREPLPPGAPEVGGELSPTVTPADVVCPLCSGSMTEVSVAGFSQLTCHVGHVFSIEALLRTQYDALEAALWAGVRALKESARVARRAAVSTPGAEDSLDERARTHDHYAEVITRMLLEDSWPPPHLIIRPPNERAV